MKTKTIQPLMSSVIMLAMAFLFPVTSCQEENPGFNSSAQPQVASAKGMANAPLTVDLEHVYAHVEDENFSMPMDDDALLFNKQTGEHIPVLSPDGHQVTLKEFNMMSGWADIKCINAGTHAVIHLKGLIPNGVYSVWLPVFNEMGTRIAFGAFGAIGGSQNFNGFMANAEGNATVSLIKPGGTMETDGTDPSQGAVSNCLADHYESHLAIAYHLDGQPQQPGPRSTWVVQGVFKIFGSQLQ